MPPFAIERVPMVSESAIPSDEVAKPMKVLLGPPMSSELEAIEVRPVPPYAAPKLEVATIVPLALVVRSADGIWKSVVEPMLLMEKRVEVAAEVEEPISKRLVYVAPLLA